MKVLLVALLFALGTYARNSGQLDQLFCPSNSINSCYNTFLACAINSQNVTQSSTQQSNVNWCACGCYATMNLCLQNCFLQNAGNNNNNNGDAQEAYLNSLRVFLNDAAFDCTKLSCPSHYCALSSGSLVNNAGNNNGAGTVAASVALTVAAAMAVF